MGKWVHVISMDDESGLATCRGCGPVQPAIKAGRPACPNRSRGGQRTPESRRRSHQRKRERFLTDDMQCAICAKQLTRETACVDHDHAICRHGKNDWHTYCPKCVRGILCATCNAGLGMYLDSPDLLRRAAEYLEAS